MRSFRLLLVRIFVLFVPETSLFPLKVAAYRWGGFKIGRGTQICSSAKFLGIGNFQILSHTWIGHQALIISTSNVLIGSYVDIAPRVYIGTGSHQIDIKGLRIAGKGMSQDIKIGDGVWIGVGAIILPGTEIGEKAIIAAGAVVKGYVPPYTMVGGVPAKVIKELNPSN